RQITRALTEEDFDGFPRPRFPRVRYACMTSYHEDWTFPVAFPPVRLQGVFGQVLAEAGLTNLRIAETEKYPHVTFFFNGGEDHEFPGERRVLVPSPRVATYDLKPEMSAPEVTEEVLRAIREGGDDAIILNFANPDMVGHTGVLEAAVRAVETVDGCLGRVLSLLEEKGGAALVTADHGNAEQMWDPETEGPHTAHTTNPTPCFLLAPGFRGKLRPGGALCDVAPTLLGLLEVPQPTEMTGRDLRML
ncbi:MAG: 2,3-bisphosphoglycerate-independent phosphoglycerate mutase, partial [Candidatus Binatia bacterium]